MNLDTIGTLGREWFHRRAVKRPSRSEGRGMNVSVGLAIPAHREFARQRLGIGTLG